MRKEIEELRRDIVFSASLLGKRLTFHSTWGLFSPRQVDAGSELLLAHAEFGERDLVLDLGCGYGALGLAIAASRPMGRVHMVDKDFVAVEYAEKNARLNGLANAEAYLSNLLSRVPADLRFDAIVSNVPAKAEREFYDILLSDAHAALKPGGRIYIVSISGLREFFKKNLRETFGNYEKLKQGGTYTVASAVK